MHHIYFSLLTVLGSLSVQQGGSETNTAAESRELSSFAVCTAALL